jgi:shikimate kinase
MREPGKPGKRAGANRRRKEVTRSHVSEEVATRPAEEVTEAARAVLGKRNLVFVGLMGAGKSAIGRIVSQMLSIPFVDTDHEIERVSRMSIPELFAAYGEPEFRALEQRVIKRLLKSGPRVVSTGGGAFMNEATRQAISSMGISVWLKADLDILWDRVSRRDNRPLLKTEDPKATLANLMAARYPVYGTAALTIASRDAEKDVIAREVIEAVAAYRATNGKDMTS